LNRAERMIAFMETLRVPEGMDAGAPLVLRPFQKNIIRGVYGPVDSRGLRIVRTAVYSVAKKNGKTPMISGLAIGHLCGPEAKINEQIYAAAYERDQAGITFRYMRQMIEMDEELSDVLTIRESTKEIYCRQTGGLFKALSSEKRSKHGLGPAVLIFDELAQFGRDREFFDTLQHGRGAHEEPLMWIISTQSPDDKAVLSEQIDYGLKVESGEIVDPTFRLFLFTTHKDADPYSVESWRQSNPALEDFLNIADMEEVARTAKNMPSAEATFRNLRLNQRIDAAAHFITPDVWKLNGDSVKLDTFDDHECYGGLDLSGKNDLTACVFVAQDEDGTYDILPYFWAPGDNIREKEDRDKAPYGYWRDHGFLEAKPGKTIDYRWVAKKIGELDGQLNIAGIRFDRWRIDDFQRALDEMGIESWIYGRDWSEGDVGMKPNGLCLIPHGQGYKDMNPAVEIVEDLLTDGKLRHGMHPVLTYCASNVRIQQDPAGNRKFDKLKSIGRIDGVTALAMALNSAVQAPVETPSVYSTRGMTIL
jgi:phage terminase large subunit-like protein